MVIPVWILKEKIPTNNKSSRLKLTAKMTSFKDAQCTTKVGKLATR